MTPQSSYRVWVHFMITSLSLLTVLMKETSLVFLQMNLWTEVTQSDHQGQGSDTHGGLTEVPARYEVLFQCERLCLGKFTFPGQSLLCIAPE